MYSRFKHFVFYLFIHDSISKSAKSNSVVRSPAENTLLISLIVCVDEMTICRVKGNRKKQKQKKINTKYVMLHDFSVVAGMTDHLSCVLIYFKYCIVVISVFISIIQRAEIFIFDVNNCSSYDLHPGIFSTVNKKKN